MAVCEAEAPAVATPTRASKPLRDDEAAVINALIRLPVAWIEPGPNVRAPTSATSASWPCP